jgi:hypothetical protein
MPAGLSLRSVLAARTSAPVVRLHKAGPDSPQVIFNTTLYNNGRRFLLTTLHPEATGYDLFADLDRSLALCFMPIPRYGRTLVALGGWTWGAPFAVVCRGLAGARSVR